MEKQKETAREGRRPSGLGLFLILLGTFFLLQEYGILPKDLPVLPVALILGGIFLVITSAF